MTVFISYSRNNKKLVDRIIHKLVEDRVSVWIDRWELKASDLMLSKI